MNITILGAGVIGVTSAWYLAKAGHSVTVIDRQPAAALETSFANAGEVSPGYSSPWAAPGIPMKALKWLFMEHAADHSSHRRSRRLALDDPDAEQLHGCALQRQQEPHGAYRRIQPRLPDGAS